MNTVKDLYDIITLPPHQLMELSAATWSHVNSDCILIPNIIKCNIEEALDDVCAYLIKTTDLHVTFTDVFAFLNDIINMHHSIES